MEALLHSLLPLNIIYGEQEHELWNLFTSLCYINDHMYRLNNASGPRGESEMLTVIFRVCLVFNICSCHSDPVTLKSWYRIERIST